VTDGTTRREFAAAAALAAAAPDTDVEAILRRFVPPTFARRGVPSTSRGADRADARLPIERVTIAGKPFTIA
jgi:hypothetical protein